MPSQPSSKPPIAPLDIQVQDLDFGNDTGILVLESVSGSPEKPPVIVHANGAAALLLAASPGSLVDEPVSLLWGGDPMDSRAHEFRAALLAVKPWSGEIALPGSQPPRWAAVRAAPERSEGNDRIRWMVWLNDITEAKARLMELRKTNAIYEIQHNLTRRSILVIDESGHIHSLNPRLAEMWQIPPEIVRTRNGEKLFARILSRIENPEAFSSVLRELRENHRDRVAGDLLLRANQIFEYRCTRCRTDENDFSGWVWYFDDVTLQRRYEERLEQARFEAETANHAKSRFLANMSHEIRTPLNGIIGMTEILSRTVLTGDQRDFLNTVQTSADNLLALIDDILDLSKIESGKVDLDITDFDLQRVVEDALSVVAPRLGDKNVDLAYHVEPGTPWMFAGDNRRISQVLINLLGNAVKFTDGGEIVVEASFEPPVPEDPRQEPQLCIAVRDTGIGIAQDDLENLFRPFTQVDSSTTRRHGGTGLGLSICSRLVELMEGRVWGESEPAKGSTFRFRIPLKPVDTPRKHLYPPELAGKRILIVDDNAANRRMLRLQTGQLGMISVETEDARKALFITEGTSRIDIVITDMQMPEMDGLMLARSLRESKLRRDIPIILLTSLGDYAGIKEEVNELGVHFVAKPIRQTQLISAISQALGHYVASAGTPARLRIPDLAKWKILLAEDNAVNRVVTEGLFNQLEKKIVCAQNGREAVEMWEKDRHDVVFMDIHMPEMDGLDATRELRQRSGSPSHPWIVALTAGALIEDRQRCREAGMNDYLSKPVNFQDLISALARRPGSFHPASDATENPKSENDRSTGAETGKILDRLRAMSMGDNAFLQKVVEVFLADFPRRLADLDEALAAEQLETVRKTAHTIKGSCGNFGADKLAQTARELEQAAAAGKTGDLAPLVKRLREGFENLRGALKPISSG